nr:MAG TPA: hypothetical protein [Caudoviricetes sp.]
MSFFHIYTVTYIKSDSYMKNTDYKGVRDSKG